MSAVRAFIDTNVFVYIYSDDEQDKRKRAISQIDRFDRVISTQVLNEFCNVCIRRLRMELPRVGAAVGKICQTNELSVINEDTIKQALAVHNRYVIGRSSNCHNIRRRAIHGDGGTGGAV